MERNKEYFYSYGQPLDDDNHHDLMSNVNFVDYKFNANDSYDEDDDDDDDDNNSDSDDDEEESDYSDHNGRDSSEEDSRLDKFGYLVDKSTPTNSELNNNSTDSNTSLKSTKLNGTIDSVNGITDSVGEKLLNGPLHHQDVQNGKLYEDKRLVDLRTQVRLIICVLCSPISLKLEIIITNCCFYWLVENSF